jgi:hypothetical protein
MGELALLFWIIFGCLMAIVNLSFAVGVLIDADELKLFRRKPRFVGTTVWALATLLGGVFVAATYWLIHHSTLNPHNLVNKKAIDEFE